MKKATREKRVKVGDKYNYLTVVSNGEDKIEKDISITDGIYDLGGIEYVNIVMQNDEISN